MHPAGGLVSGTLVNALLFHFGHPALEIAVPDDDDDDGDDDTGTGGSQAGVANRTGDGGFGSDDEEDAEAPFSLSAALSAVAFEAAPKLPPPPPPGPKPSRGPVGHPAPGVASGSELRQGIVRPGIVHRLDRFTSGVMVVAKDPAAHAHLHAQFAAKTTTRCYEVREPTHKY